MRSPTWRKQLRRARDAVLALWLVGWGLFIAPACGPGQYVYDPNGRLVAVLDPTQDNAGGGTAIYTYDGAGNLTAIRRQATTTVMVLSFTPSCGPAGTSVSIYGTGFTSTTGVMFNGVSASSVTFVSSTQLTATVPSAAATGPIRVSGDVSNPDLSPFRVNGCGNGSGPPAITSFTTCPGAGQVCSTSTPACCIGSGVIPTAATISGTSFDMNPANDRLTFHHGRLANVATPNMTQIATSTPAGATSGKLTLATPQGVAISPLDFFAPPPGWGIANVDPGQMVRMPNPTVGGSVPPWTLHMPSPDANNAPRLGLALFDATIGDTPCWSADTSHLTGAGPNGSGYTSLSLIDPDGNYLPLTSNLSGPSMTPIVTMTAPTRASPLPATGTYTFVTQPSAGTTGTVTLTAYTASATFKAIVPTLAGAVVPVMPTGPCQQTWLRFTGSAGHRLTATATNVSPSNFAYTMDFWDGTVTSHPTGGTDCLRIGPLTASGPWQLLVTTNGPGQSTGSLTVNLYDIVDLVTPTTIDPTSHSTTVHLVIRAPGEFPTAQFVTLPNSQTVSVTINNVNPPYSFGFGPAAILLDANKQYVASGVGGFGPVSVSQNSTYFLQLAGNFQPCWVGSADVTITNN